MCSYRVCLIAEAGSQRRVIPETSWVSEQQQLQQPGRLRRISLTCSSEDEKVASIYTRIGERSAVQSHVSAFVMPSSAMQRDHAHASSKAGAMTCLIQFLEPMISLEKVLMFKPHGMQVSSG